MIDHQDKLDAATLLQNGDVDGFRQILRDRPGLLENAIGSGNWLFMAAQYNQLEIAKHLLDLGQDPNERERLPPHNVPLVPAIRKQYLEVAELLLSHGADPNMQRLVISGVRSKGNRALEAVKLLEEFGADLHQEYFHHQLKQPMNALSAAKDAGKDDVVEYLLSKGARLPEGVEQGLPDRLKNAIVRFFEQKFGPAQKESLVEIVPGRPSITIYAIHPQSEGAPLTLFTSGMSDLPMTVPAGTDDYRFAELFVQLPGDWKYRELADPKWGWPVEWLRRNAKYPHNHETWLGGPVCLVANDDPPQPIAPDCEFTTLLLLAEHKMQREDGNTVHFYRTVPLFTAERQLELDEGSAALMRTLDIAGVSMVVDMNRQCAV